MAKKKRSKGKIVLSASLLILGLILVIIGFLNPGYIGEGIVLFAFPGLVLVLSSIFLFFTFSFKQFFLSLLGYYLFGLLFVSVAFILTNTPIDFTIFFVALFWPLALIGLI